MFLVPLRAELSPATSFHETCENLAKKWPDEARKRANKIFQNRADTLAMTNRISQQFRNYPDLTFSDVKMLHKTCAHSLAISYEYAPFCELFTDRELELMNLQDDIDDYHSDAYGADPIVYKSACTVIKEAVNFIDTANSNTNTYKSNAFRKVALRFSHAGAMKPLIALLDLFKDNRQTFDVESMSPSTRRLWRSSEVSPFAANVIFVALVKNNPQGSQYGFRTEITDRDIQIVTLVQERAHRIDHCRGDSEFMCSLSNFKLRFAEQLHKCDLNRMCSQSGSSKQSYHLLQTLLAFVTLYIFL